MVDEVVSVGFGTESGFSGGGVPVRGTRFQDRDAFRVAGTPSPDHHPVTLAGWWVRVAPSEQVA
jgi:hypothetical protein